MIERRLVSRPVSTIGTLIAPRVTQEEGPRIVTEGLVGHWDAGNPYSYPGTGTTWTDLSGNAINGTLTNGPTYSSDRGGVFTLDGVNDHVNCGNNALTRFNNTAAFTVEGWAYFSAITGYPAIAGQDTVGSPRNGYELLALETSSTTAMWGFERFGAGTAAGAYGPAVNKSELTNRWVHLVGTYNGSTLTLYENSISIATATGVTTSNNNTTTPLYFGRLFSSYLKGAIAIVRIYSRALSSAEITQNFNATRGRFGL